MVASHLQLIEAPLSASAEAVAQTTKPLLGETGHGSGSSSSYNPRATGQTDAAPASLMKVPNLAADNLGDLRQSLAELVKGVIQTNLRTSQEMLRVTNHNEFVALQQRFVRDYLAALMHGSRQLVSTIQRLSAGQPSPLS